MANADGACGGDEDGREGEIDYGVMDSARTAGGAGEIESGGVVHGADMPDGGKECFIRFAVARERAERNPLGGAEENT